VPKQRVRRLKALTLTVISSAKQKYIPSAGEEVRVLGGRINHVAATISLLSLTKGRDVGGDAFYVYHYAPSSTCTDSFSIPPALPTVAKQDEEDVGAAQNLWFDNKWMLYFTGGTGAKAFLILEVVKVDPITGEHLA